MRNFKTPLIGFLVSLFGLLAPIYMLFLVWFIRKDDKESYANGTGPTPFDDSFIVRGDLPNAFRFAQTMDSRFPGGLYEPKVKEWYEKYGFYITSYLWAGWRNRAMGLSYILGGPALGYIPDPFTETMEGWTRNGNTLYFERATDETWKVFHQFFFIQFQYGYQVYRLHDGTYHKVPLFTLRFKNN